MSFYVNLFMGFIYACTCEFWQSIICYISKLFMQCCCFEGALKPKRPQNSYVCANPGLQDLGDAVATLKFVEDAQSSAQASFTAARDRRDYVAAAALLEDLKQVGFVVLGDVECRCSQVIAQ